MEMGFLVKIWIEMKKKKKYLDVLFKNREIL